MYGLLKKKISISTRVDLRFCTVHYTFCTCTGNLIFYFCTGSCLKIGHYTFQYIFFIYWREECKLIIKYLTSKFIKLFLKLVSFATFFSTKFTSSKQKSKKIIHISLNMCKYKKNIRQTNTKQKVKSNLKLILQNT